MITIGDPIQKAAYALNDAGMVRWTEPTWLGWAEECMQVIASQNPDMFRAREALNMTAGVEQPVPATFTRVLRVTYSSVNGKDREVRYVDWDSLTRLRPNWRSDRASAVPRNYTYNGMNRDRIEVYPPHPDTPSGTLTVEYNTVPPSVAAMTTTVDLPSTFTPAITDYLLYRALINDAEEVDARDRATLHYKQFIEQIMGRAMTDNEVRKAMT